LSISLPILRETIVTDDGGRHQTLTVAKTPQNGDNFVASRCGQMMAEAAGPEKASDLILGKPPLPPDLQA
jgi:hypothetical protein